MSTADEWDITVPDDDADLLEELHRRGARPGLRLRVSVINDGGATATGQAKPARRRLSFAGLMHAEPDLSERTDEYMRGWYKDGRRGR